MTALAKYDAACKALAAAKAVDEVKTIRDKAIAMKEYARQAKNKEMEIDAAEIRMRAERRLGEMLKGQRETVGLNKGAAAGGKKGAPRGSFVEQRDQSPTLADVGIDRKLSMRAQKIAAIPEAKFEGMVGEWRERVTKENERVSANLLKEGDKAEKRAAKEAELAAKQTALPNKKFGVIYADPEWKFETYSENGMDRAADNHYPTSTTETIMSRDVASIAADDCVLFLWATVPMLPDALRVMEAWGFDYKSNFAWVKNKIGTGYWSRNKHELLLVGTKGKIPAPAMGTQFPSVIEAPVGKHSEKPVEGYEIIESYFPNLPKIELNARNRRDGWDAWGYEAGETK